MKRIFTPIFAFCALFSFANAEDGKHILFLLGEKEYKTLENVPKFFESELKPAGFTATFISAPHEDGVRNDFPGMADALAKADLVFVSVRRRAPKTEDMEALKAFAAAGKPLVAIRTSSHAFHLRGKPAPEGHGLWEEFDPAVLGGNYNGHYGNEPAPITKVSENHPILADVGDLPATSKLYRAAPLKEGTTELLRATVDGKPAEPVAWTHTFGPENARIFYTSLGLDEEFANPEFRKFLKNAVEWAIGG